MSKTKKEPLYERLKDKITQRILSGELAPLSRLPSQIELCRNYDVSQITVRRAIQELTDAGLLTTRPGSGTYVAETPTRNQLTARATICVVVENILGGFPLMPGYPLVRSVVSTLRDRCQSLGYKLQFVEVAALNPVHDDEAVQPPAGCIGAILTSPVSVPMIRAFQRAKVPYVLGNNDLSDGFSYCVMTGFAWGVLKAALHLYEIGCKNLMLVTAEELRQSAGQMRMGLEMAHSAAAGLGNIPKPQVVAGSYEPDHAYQLTRAWIEKDTLPDGIIYASDIMARAGLFALVRAGVKVPERVAIVGFGNTVQPSETPIEISVIDPNDHAVGNAIMDVLGELIQNRKPALHYQVIEPQLVIRASSSRT